MLWKATTGDIRIKDMDDTHVVNIVHLLINSRIPNLKKRRKEAKAKKNTDVIEYLEDIIKETKYVLKNFKNEMNYRKLPESMLDDAPFPFKDKKDGELKKWDYEAREAKIVSKAKRFITED
jgi:hypothetical protein